MQYAVVSEVDGRPSNDGEVYEQVVAHAETCSRCRQWLAQHAIPSIWRRPQETQPGQAQTRPLRWVEVEQEGGGDPVPHGSLRRWAQEYPEIPGQDQVASRVRRRRTK